MSVTLWLPDSGQITASPSSLFLRGSLAAPLFFMVLLVLESRASRGSKGPQGEAHGGRALFARLFSHILIM